MKDVQSALFQVKSQNREITEEKKRDLLAMNPYLPNEENREFYRQICE